MYSRDDFKKLRYNTYDLKKGDKLNFPDLKLYSAFSIKIKGVDKALLFKWISYMYDPNSPLVNITDIRKRAVIAANEAHFLKKNSGKFENDYANVVMYNSSIMVDLGKIILQYCRLHRNNDYLQMVVYQMRLMYNMESLADPTIDTKESIDLIKSNELIGTAVDGLQISFLNGDTTEATYAEILDAIEMENMEFSPEQMLLNEKVRKSINDFAPYGNRYKGEKYSKKDLSKAEKLTLTNKLNNNTAECRTHFDSLGI